MLKSTLGALMTMTMTVLIACTGGPADPSGEEFDKQTGIKTPSAGESSDEEQGTKKPSNYKPGPGEDGDRKPTTPTPAEPAPTCDGLVSWKLPAATFAVDPTTTTIAKPVDVFVTERSYDLTPPNEPVIHQRSLSIALTQTTRECTYRDNKLSPRTMDERRIVVYLESTAAMPAAIGAGVYDSKAAGTGTRLGFEMESGERCQPPPPQGTAPGGIGTALSGGHLDGKVTITKRTDAIVEGTIDVAVSMGDGGQAPQRLVMSFSAPICSEVNRDDSRAAAPVVCCANTK